MKKGGGSESTIIIGPSKSVLVYALHSLEYVLGLARFRVFVPKLKNLHRMGKANSPLCLYGDGCTDDAEHTFFECSKWRSERYALQQQLGIDKVNPNYLTNILISNFQNWRVYSERMLRQKKMDLDEYHNTETQEVNRSK